jgi:hypothetical protein
MIRLRGVGVVLIIFQLVSMFYNIPGLNVLARTFNHATKEILVFILILVLGLVAFAVPFIMIFSQSIASFNNFGRAFFALFRGLMGDMPIDDMLAVDNTYATLLYMLFNSLMVIVLINIVIAIFSDAYNCATLEVEHDEIGEQFQPCIQHGLCGVAKDKAAEGEDLDTQGQSSGNGTVFVPSETLEQMNTMLMDLYASNQQLHASIEMLMETQAENEAEPPLTQSNWGIGLCEANVD